MKTSSLRHALKWTAIGPLVLITLFVVSACNQSKSVMVESDPPGAEVLKDGTRVGAAPVRVAGVTNQTRLGVVFPGKRDSSSVIKSTGPPRTVVAGYLPLTANLPLFVAMDQGYFDRLGLKVKAVEASTPNDIVAGLLSADIDFAAVLAYTILFPTENKLPGSFKIFGSTEETADAYTSSIIVLKDSPIRTMSDLKGKKVGVYSGLVQVNFLKAILIGAGINPKDVEIVQINPRLQIQGLVSDQYDALSSTEPTVNIAVIHGIARVLDANSRVRHIMCPFPSTATTISPQLLRDDPETANRIVRALGMAIDFINYNPVEAKRSLVRYTPIPKDIEKQVLADLKLFKYAKLGEENRLNVQRFADFCSKNGIIEKPISDVNTMFADYRCQ